MDSLYQRLKELDHDTFQRLCFQLLKERHPGADLRHVEGASGDEGLDVFQGELSGTPTIWQCKAFPSGVGKSQKGQIRKSLKSALANFKPQYWILCLSVDLDSKASSWWEKFKKSHAKKVTIGEMFASHIVHELIHRRTLRNHFFPGASIDPIELKRVMRGTGELTPEELEAVTESTLEDYIERLKERDARFNYEIVFSGDLGPEYVQKRRPGLVMSFQSGAKRVNVFARDVEALQQDPPKINLRFTKEGVGKYRTLIKTGFAQTFTKGEFEHLSTDVPFLPTLHENQTLIIGPTESLKNRRVKARLTFIGLDHNVEYSFVELAPERVGTEEFALKTVSNSLPFELEFELLWKGTGKFNYTPRFINADVRQIAKFLGAVRILCSGGTVTLHDLEREAQLFEAQTKAVQITEAQRKFHDLIADLDLITETLRVPIRLPPDVKDDDFHAISLLKTICSGGSKSVDDLSFNLMKSEANSDLVRTLPRVAAFRAEHPNYEPKPKLFG